MSSTTIRKIGERYEGLVLNINMKLIYTYEHISGFHDYEEHQIICKYLEHILRFHIFFQFRVEVLFHS